MLDVIPERYISLVDAFGLYRLWLWGGHEPFTELELEKRCEGLPASRRMSHRAAFDRIIEVELDGFVGVFRSGRLEALLRPIGCPTNISIPRSAWDEGPAPHRLLLSVEIVGSEGSYFASAVGRTPFTSHDALVELLRRSPPISSDAGHETQVPVAADLRSLLGDLVMDGVVGTAEAEAFATNWRLGRFERSPAADGFDPMKRVAWTLPMTIAWILWRTPGQVRLYDDAYRTECRKWFAVNWSIAPDDGSGSYEVHGHELRRLGAASYFELENMDASSHSDGGDPSKGAKVRSAREDIWRHLAEGKLVVSAVDKDGRVGKVPENEWLFLSVAFSMSGPDHLVWSEEATTVAYSRLRFERQQVLSIWRPLGGAELSPDVSGIVTKKSIVLIGGGMGRGGKLEAAKEAVSALFPGGPPTGLTVKDRLKQVNAWLLQNNRSKVGMSTVFRAITELKKEM